MLGIENSKLNFRNDIYIIITFFFCFLICGVGEYGLWVAQQLKNIQNYLQL